MNRNVQVRAEETGQPRATGGPGWKFALKHRSPDRGNVSGVSISWHPASALALLGTTRHWDSTAHPHHRKSGECVEPFTLFLPSFPYCFYL